MAKSFLVHESEWLSALETLAPIGSSRTVWVRVQSEDVWTLPAMPCQILVDERVLYFRLPPAKPLDVPQIEIKFFLPDEGATFEKRVYEGENQRLEMQCLVKWHQQRYSQAFRLIVATGEEFLMLPDSEVQLQ